MTRRSVVVVLLALAVIAVTRLATLFSESEEETAVLPSPDIEGQSDTEVQSGGFLEPVGNFSGTTSYSELEAQANETSNNRAIAGIPVWGHIVLPEGTPTDESIEIIVETRPPDDEYGWRIYGWGGKPIDAGRYPAAEDGSFTVLLPERAARAS